MIETRPAVMIGGGHQALGLEALRGAGYTVFDSLPANQTLERATLPVAVVLGEGHLPYWTDAPETDARATLAEMTLSALELLSSNPRGFLLVVEGARIDHASHSNDFDRMIGEATDFVAAVHAALDWREEAAARELLIVATSDHETGGLSIADAGVDGEIPTAQWSTRRHTARLVPLFAIGPGSERVESTMDNTDVFSLLVGR
jgi:alkaline phosphatase